MSIKAIWSLRARSHISTALAYPFLEFLQCSRLEVVFAFVSYKLTVV